MRFSARRGDEDIYINVVPFIDVLLVLLIFFLVSTTFMEQSQLALTLPTVSEEASTPESNVVRIEVDRDGRVAVGKQTLPDASVESIKAAVAAEAEGKSEPAIVIAADAEARHQSVVTAMDAIRQLGYKHLSIATEVEDGTP